MSSRRDRPWLLLPVESNVRELPARVLLAAVAAERGFEAVIARRAELPYVIPSLPPSVILNTSVIHSEPVRHARRHGHVVTALDEEGLVYRQPDEYAGRRLSPEVLGDLTRFFAWGEVHAQVVRPQIPDGGAEVVVTGNPRMDLLRREVRGVFDAETEALRERFGSFVLVNSNFGMFNHELGRDSVVRNWQANGWLIGRGEEILARVLALQGRLMDEFVALVRQLAPAIAPTALIVRPHPAEDHLAWRRLLEGEDNVHVLHEGPVIPWLRAADVLIHNACTTGIESVVLGRPTIAYVPVRDPEVEAGLPNEVSSRLSESSDVVTTVKAVLRNGAAEGSGGQFETLAAHVANLSGPLASEEIAEHLWDVAPDPPSTVRHATIRRSIAWSRSIARLRSLIGSARRRDLLRQRRLDGFYRRVSPSIDDVEIDAHLRRLRMASDRFQGVESVRLTRDVVLLTAGKHVEGRMGQ